MTVVSNSSYENHTLRNSLIAASLGAGTIAGATSLQQHILLNRQDKGDSFVASVAKHRAELEQNGEKPLKFWSQYQDGIIEAVKNRKFDAQFVKKSSGYAAAICGGAYLAYRGVRSFFVSE